MINEQVYYSDFGDKFNYNRLENEINSKAKAQASEFMKIRKLENQSLTFDKVFVVCKFLETPLKMVVEGLESKSRDEIKKYYKQIAMSLHPDKNSHPKSKEAFQKF